MAATRSYAMEDCIYVATLLPSPIASADRNEMLTSAGLHRIDPVDGLRAFAALWVVMHHAIETCHPERLVTVPVAGTIVQMLFRGQFAVMVFLVLSGFCLYYPLVRKAPRAPALPCGYYTYITRRARRIYPPYIAAIAFCLTMVFALPEMGVGADKFWNSVFPISGPIIVSHLFMVHNLIPGHSTRIDPPMWSIGLEWQLYLLFPILVWAMLRFRPIAILAATLLLGICCRLPVPHMAPLGQTLLRDGPFAYGMVFAAGMVAARMIVDRNNSLPRIVLLSTIGAGAFVIRYGSGNGLLHDLMAMAFTVAVLLLALDSNSAASRLLSWRPLVRIGQFSYSIYLIHVPLLHLAFTKLQPFNLSNDTTLIVLEFVGIPIIVAISYIFHLGFEKPFMRAQKSITNDGRS